MYVYPHIKNTVNIVIYKDIQGEIALVFLPDSILFGFSNECIDNDWCHLVKAVLRAL